jgi:hypothetical protein
MTQRGGKLKKEGKTLDHKHFEANLLEIETKNPQVRLDKNEDRFNWDKHAQRYTNLVTQAMWLGYTIAVSASRTYAKGNFIIAHTDEAKGLPVFTERPYVHPSFSRGVGELKRLASRYRGRKFVLYNSVQVAHCEPYAEERAIEGGIDTGFIDDQGIKIFVGDTLHNFEDYDVTVCCVAESEGLHFYGKLVCEPGHSCENIPYSLNEGKGHTIIKFVTDFEEVEPEAECALDESF